MNVRRRPPWAPRAGPARPGAAVLAACALLAACTLLGGCSSATGAQGTTVRAVEMAGPGRVLADSAGRTLYVYLPDDHGRSRCSGPCAEIWPPLLLPAGASRPVAGPGAEARLLGTTRRAGGALQVTYAGWPLYTYRNDFGSGQATGQGEGMGAWYLMSTSGAVDRAPLAGTAGS